MPGPLILSPFDQWSMETAAMPVDHCAESVWVTDAVIVVLVHVGLMVNTPLRPQRSAIKLLPVLIHCNTQCTHDLLRFESVIIANLLFINYSQYIDLCDSLVVIV